MNTVVLLKNWLNMIDREKSHRIIYVTEDVMRKICHRLAVEFFDSEDEPIADVASANHHALHSALGQPQMTFEGKQLYVTLADQEFY